jgi:hypothetical protein
MIVFQYDDELKQYKKLELTGEISLPALLNSDYIFMFIDRKRNKTWVWQGSNTTTKIKFFSGRLAPSIRDKYGTGFKIIVVDESNEPLGFKVMIGLEKEPDDSEVRENPLYEGTKEDIELFESFSRVKRLLRRFRDADF